MLVSVIIPNYNHAPFLQKRIESVLQQTWPHFEVILMDDCSTDNSVEIINRYKNHPRVSHTVINTINSGSPFFQWEKGLALTKGEIIWIAESDDYAELNFLEELLPFFSNTIGIVYCDSNIVDANDVTHKDFYKKFRNDRFKTEKWNADYKREGVTELRENLFYECTINNMSATLFKKSLLKYIDWPFLKSFKYCGDWFFLVSLAMHTQIAYNRTALNFFKYGTDNFKKGTRSVLNYFGERSRVRYFFWKNLSSVFSKQEKRALYRQMGIEMKIQINEMVKRNSPARQTILHFRQLSWLNFSLFRKQINSAFKSYLWKS